MDDLTQEFEAQPTMSRARIPPRHAVGSSSDPALAVDETPAPGRASTLDALIAELRIANARVMASEPDDGPGAAVTRPATSAPASRVQDSCADPPIPPLAAAAQGSHAETVMPLPPGAQRSRLDPPVVSGRSHPPPPSAGPGRPGYRPARTAPPSAPPGSRPRVSATTAPAPGDTRSGPPVPPGARGSRPGLTEPPRHAQGSHADPFAAPPRPPAICGEHAIVTPAPRRAQTSHVDPLVTPRRAQASHVDPLVTPRRAQASHVDPLVTPRRAPSPAPRRARTEPSAATRRAQSRADRSSITPAPRRARTTIDEVNCDLPASDRR